MIFRLADQDIKYHLAQGQELFPLTSGVHPGRWVRYPCLFLSLFGNFYIRKEPVS